MPPTPADGTASISAPAAEPNSPPAKSRRPVLQLFLGFLIMLGTQIGSFVVVWAVLALLRLDPELTVLDGDISTKFLASPLSLIPAMVLYALLSLFGFHLLTKRFAPTVHATTFSAGLGAELLLGCAIGATVITGAIAILWLAGVYHAEDPALRSGIMLGLAISIGAAFGEEVFFRGFLLRILDERWGSTIAVLISGLIFGAAHFTNPGAKFWGAAAIVLQAALLIPASYLLTDRLWVPIGMHFAWNATQSSLFGTTISGTFTQPGFFAGSLEGPPWLSGGAMGLEGSIVVVGLAFFAGVILTVLCIRKGRWRSYRQARAEVKQARAWQHSQKTKAANASPASSHVAG